MSHASRIVVVAALAGALAACGRGAADPGPRTFATPEEAAQALSASVKRGNLEEVLQIFGPDGRALVDSSDAVTARQHREIFSVAMAERWRLDADGDSRRTLVVGNEDWPFPIPLVRDGTGWRFDAAAGREEVIARRIGSNELAAIRTCGTYVAAQRIYAKRGHDGKRPGLYARTFHSDPGQQNGLYWPARHGERRSPLGDLLAAAAEDASARQASGGSRQPFHGYYFRILTAQGPAAPGGERDYIAGGEMTGGFALVAWPAEYDVTGVMTFVVNQDGILWEQDLGPGTDAAARAMTAYDPDTSWTRVAQDAEADSLK